MNQLLQLGQNVELKMLNTDCKIEKFLGGGAQGEVYQVTIAGQPMALKWYFPHYLKQDPTLRQRIEQTIQFGPPSDRFLWPLEVATHPQVSDSFGYLMPLRETRFKGLVDLVARRVQPSFRTLASAGFELAHSYLQLHARGLCYRDISFGNVFFDPANGEVRICDNDNVDINGVQGAIGGTIRFMAPEIVRGVAAPDTETDLFSLAVLLFYLLCNHHPLEGKRESAIRCFDQAAMTKLYGTAPLFIFDPKDDDNRPVPGEHDNALAFWAIYPTFLRTIFTRAFTVGIHDPGHGRVRESEWRTALVRLRDSILYCTQCRAENFYDAEALRATRQPPVCWACGQSVPLPPRLRIQQNGEASVIILNHDTQLFPHHIDSNRPYDFSTPVAAVTQHPSNAQLWGLKNFSNTKWVITPPEGPPRDVPPGRSVTLAAHTRLHFGPSEGEIRV